MENQANAPAIYRFRWLGSEAPSLDAVRVTCCGDVVIGCYGGHTGAGAERNEDGALVWCAADGAWEFALLLDAHGSAESARLVLTAVDAAQCELVAALSQPVETAFLSLHQCLLALFSSLGFRARCRSIQGETACLICARKGRFLWWLCIGDCVLYLFHADLARLGQYALNQRGFFEWVGRANTFELPVPCYSTGVREMRGGVNRILLATDGLFECGTRPWENPEELSHHFISRSREGEVDLEQAVSTALACVHEEQGRDSATVIAWSRTVEASGLRPST